MEVKQALKFTAALLASLVLAFVVVPHHHHHNAGPSLCFISHDGHDHSICDVQSDGCSSGEQKPCEECPLDRYDLIVETSSHNHSSKCSVSDCGCDHHVKAAQFSINHYAVIPGSTDLISPYGLEISTTYNQALKRLVHVAFLKGLSSRAPPIA